MAKIIGQEQPKERELTQEDIIAMAKYIQHLEGVVKTQQEQIEKLKTYAITLGTQRNNAERRYKGLKTEIIQMQEPAQTTIEINGETIMSENPSEQYRDIKQF